MKITYFLEILLYEWLDLIPNIIIFSIVFKNHFRFSRTKTGIFIFLLYAFLVISRVISVLDQNMGVLLTVFWIPSYLLALKCMIRTSFTKLFFLLLNMLNYGSFITVLYTYFSSYVYEGKEFRAYSIMVSGIYFSILLVSYPFIFFIMIKRVNPVIELLENRDFFRYLWCIPAIFCLSYYYNLYSNGGIYIFASKLKNVVFAVLFNIGAIFVTWITMYFIQENNKNMHIRMENHYLRLQAVQYENLKNKMEESRRAKHDMRQVLRIVQSYVYQGEYERLKSYLDDYLKTVPSESTFFYCSNYALNALLVYYKDLAENYEIPFEISIQIENTEHITDTEVIVLYGNLLENAMEACLEEENKNPYIYFSMVQAGNGIYTVIKNSYKGALNKKEGGFETTKEGHTGIGLYSVEQIVKKYEGQLVVETELETFCVSFLFYP